MRAHDDGEAASGAGRVLTRDDQDFLLVGPNSALLTNVLLPALVLPTDRTEIFGSPAVSAAREALP
jgi:hypothetical protein